MVGQWLFEAWSKKLECLLVLLDRVWNKSRKARAEPVTENQPDVENVSSHLLTQTYQRIQRRVVLEVTDSGTKEDKSGVVVR